MRQSQRGKPLRNAELDDVLVDISIVGVLFSKYRVAIAA